MRRRIVSLGMIMVISSFIVFGYYDEQLRLVLFGFPESRNFQGGLAGRGATDGAFGPGVQLTSTGFYLRLSAYLLGAAGIMVAIIGLLLSPKVKEPLEGLSGGESTNTRVTFHH